MDAGPVEVHHDCPLIVRYLMETTQLPERRTGGKGEKEDKTAPGGKQTEVILFGGLQTDLVNGPKFVCEA